MLTRIPDPLEARLTRVLRRGQMARSLNPHGVRFIWNDFRPVRTLLFVSSRVDTNMVFGEAAKQFW